MYNSPNWNSESASADNMLLRLEIRKASSLPNDSRFGSARFSVSVYLDDQEYKTSITQQGISPVFNEVFVLCGQPSSKVTIKVLCIHSMIKNNTHVICETNAMEVYDLLSTQGRDHFIPLQILSNRIKEVRGEKPSITIRMSANSGSTAPVIRSSTAALLKATTLSGDSVVQGVLQGDMSVTRSNWANLLAKLHAFARIAEAIGQLDEKVRVAVTVMTVAFQLVVQQHDRDIRVNHLIDTMAKLYDVLLDIRPIERIISFEKTIGSIISQTIECAYFVTEYCSHSSFAQRFAEYTLSNVDEVISDFERAFNNLRIDLLIGSTTQVTLVTMRILKNVQKVSNMLARISNTLDLPLLRGASWSPRLTCLPGTLDDTLDEIKVWVATPGNQRICLLLGDQKSGKTSLAHSTAQQFWQEGRLGSAIFLRHKLEPTAEQACQSELLFTTIARELAAFDEAINLHISSALHRQPLLGTADIERQFPELVVRPLSELAFVGPILIVIDGLNHCDNLRHVVAVMTKSLDRLPPNVRFLITSRPEDVVEAAFGGLPQCFVHRLQRTEKSEAEVMSALEHLQHLNSKIFEEHTTLLVATKAQERSLDIPLWKSTILSFLRNCTSGESKELVRRLMAFNVTSDPRAAMEDLYSAILDTLLPANISESSSFARSWNSVLGFMIYRLPISITTAESFLLHATNRRISSRPIATLYACGCIVDVKDEQRVIMHPSFEQFITNTMMSKWSQQRYSLATLCLDVMNTFLTRNICRIEDSSVLNSELAHKDALIQQHVPEALNYACLNWISHLLCIKIDEVKDGNELFEQLHQFLFEHLLHWFELMSLLDLLDTAYRTILSLREWLQANKAPDPLLRMVPDGIRFIKKFGYLMSIATLHIYETALLFTPKRTLLFETYQKYIIEDRQIEVSGVEEEWLPLSLVLRGHQRSISHLAFSPDGRHIASASWDNSVRVWDAELGLLTGMFEHPAKVLSVVFSPDALYLASGTEEGKVSVWRLDEGKLVAEFQGPVDDITCIAFSPDETEIIACFDGSGVCINDSQTGRYISGPVQGYAQRDNAIAFIDGRLIVASTSLVEETVRIWDGKTGQAVDGGRPLKHTSFVECIAFSPSGSHLACGTVDGEIWVWVWDAARMWRVLDVSPKRGGHSGGISALRFSNSGDMLVSVSWDKTMRVRDLRAQREIRCFSLDEGTNALALSPDGSTAACASISDRVLVWDLKSESESAAAGTPSLTGNVTNIPGITHDLMITFGFPVSYLNDEPHDRKRWYIDKSKRRVLWLPHQYSGRMSGLLKDVRVLASRLR
ncbi:hypothetical protein AMATHDRAFT_41059 [Amanita thiersii Skay4041]|uniref:C2 domain-containing protein n=1 Tax=Amanita thiersii Skay4041 TaxID=703135 RepID=A0A2A9NR15_9AGAR|nr:hypothetical protein AMATHDRAFT_41059 [Amanita thiersii Skay4041]